MNETKNDPFKATENPYLKPGKPKPKLKRGLWNELPGETQKGPDQPKPIRAK